MTEPRMETIRSYHAGLRAEAEANRMARGAVHRSRGGAMHPGAFRTFVAQIVSTVSAIVARPAHPASTPRPRYAE